MRVYKSVTFKDNRVVTKSVNSLPLGYLSRVSFCGSHFSNERTIKREKKKDANDFDDMSPSPKTNTQNKTKQKISEKGMLTYKSGRRCSTSQCTKVSQGKDYKDRSLGGGRTLKWSWRYGGYSFVTRQSIFINLKSWKEIKTSYRLFCRNLKGHVTSLRGRIIEHSYFIRFNTPTSILPDPFGLPLMSLFSDNLDSRS